MHITDSAKAKLFDALFLFTQCSLQILMPLQAVLKVCSSRGCPRQPKHLRAASMNEYANDV